MSIFDRPISRRQVLKAGAAVPAAMMLAQAAPAAAAQRVRGAAGRFAAASSTTMTMSDWWGSQFGHYYPAMQKLTGVTIDQQLYPYSTTKLFTQLDAGSAADIFLVDSHWNGTLLPEVQQGAGAVRCRVEVAKGRHVQVEHPPDDRQRLPRPPLGPGPFRYAGRDRFRQYRARRQGRAAQGPAGVGYTEFTTPGSGLNGSIG